MSDLIDLAIARFTDWARFERLAADIMGQEGYPDLEVLGGMHDEGQDARVERFFLSVGKRIRVVFQFSLQEDVARKTKATLERLAKAGVAFEKLVIVTTNPVSPEMRRKIAVEARRDRDVELVIFERDTIAQRLSDAHLFARYFPDIDSQVEALRGKARPATGAPEVEFEQLRVCQALLLGEKPAHSRNALVDSAVLALLSGTPQAVAELLALAAKGIGAPVMPEGQIRAALERLTKRGLAAEAGARFVRSTDAVVRIESAAAAVEASERAVEGDLLGEVEEALGTELAAEERRQVLENARAVLAEFFRANGLEIAGSFNESPGGTPLVYAEATARCVEAARRRLPAHVGDLLVAAVAGALSSPTEGQAAFFAKRSRAYVAMQVLNLDPSLREFQVTRFKAKTFLLDTDFVLQALVVELPLSSTYRALYRELGALGAQVLLPEEVLREVLIHLEISPRTYDHFSGGLNGLSADLAASRVWNVLVRGYWHASVEQGLIATRDGFLKYRENFFDSSSPLAFLLEGLKEALPAVTLTTVGKLATGWSKEEEAKVAELFARIASRSPKAPDRTEEQQKAIDLLDAQLCLSLHTRNEEAKERGGVLGMSTYIVTSSGRFLRAARELGLRFAHSTRPQVLASLIELVSPRRISDREYVALFENPLLNQAVEESWADLKVLLSAGLNLRGKSLARLKADLEQKLHQSITRLEEADAAATEAGAENAGASEAHADDQHVRLLAEAKGLGYRAAELLENLVGEKKADATHLARLTEENAALRERVTRFGKKHERWLKRLRRQGPR